ncbi:MAG: hypothetical protein MJK12_06785 [Colwellia sp.]|nr:hypothetical protein [Colwellia sp.]
MTTLANSSLINDFIANRCSAGNFSCKSFIVTVFGDVLSQHGDWLWLGSLIESLKPLGYSERLIRTSVFRLVQDDWLQVKKVGRKSFYAFTESAKLHYEKAARRIYSSTHDDWHGNWLLVLPSFVSEQAMPAFRRQLHWLGFSSLSSGVFAHPCIEQTSLNETLKELQLTDAVVVFSCKTIDDCSAKVLKTLVQKRWHISELAEQYQQLLISYQVLMRKVEGKDKAKMLTNIKDPLNDISEQQSFLLRTLLIHEYRRILLKDHELPKQMLPEQWQGFAARQLVNNLYSELAQPSLSYIRQQLQNSSGGLPKEQASYWQRFS